MYGVLTLDTFTGHEETLILITIIFTLTSIITKFLTRGSGKMHRTLVTIYQEKPFGDTPHVWETFELETRFIQRVGAARL